MFVELSVTFFDMTMMTIGHTCARLICSILWSPKSLDFPEDDSTGVWLKVGYTQVVLAVLMRNLSERP